MELTEEQFKQILTEAITANNKLLDKKFIDKDNMSLAMKEIKDMVKEIPNVDTNKFANKEEVKIALDEAVKKINEDLQKIVKKVFPDMPASQKTSWWMFD